MPDWFYRTVSQPILFRLPAPRARDFALGFIGRLARLPLGPFLIDFLGHMRADPRLRRSLLDTDFPTAVGLGPWLDTRLIATEALSRFGVGFIEVGPIRPEGNTSGESVKRLVDEQALWIGPDAGSISIADCKLRLSKADGLKVPLIVRLDHDSDEALQRLIRELPDCVRLVSLTTLAMAAESGWSIERWSEHLGLVIKAARPRHILLCINADRDLAAIAPMIEVALGQGLAGFVVDGSVKADPNGRLVGLPVRERALQQVRHLRELAGVSVPIISSGGIHEPGHALAGGWVFLLPALWGYRRGSSWLWWTLLIAGSIAYAAGIVVHYAVGYLSFKHLLPAFGGFGLLFVGLLLSYPFLCRTLTTTKTQRH